MSIVTIVSRPVLFVRGHEVTATVDLYDGSDDVVTPTTWTSTLRRNGSSVGTGSGSGAASWAYTAATTMTAADDYEVEWVLHDGHRIGAPSTAGCGLSPEVVPRAAGG